MLPLPRRTSPRIAAVSPQDSGLPAASASSARPHSGGPSASLGATSEPADTPSPRRLWPLPVISAEYRRASGGAAAVPSFAQRGLFFRTCPATGSAFLCPAPLVPRCAAAGEVSPDPSRPRPDAAFGLDHAGAPPPPPRTPLRPPSYRWLHGGARQPPVQSRRLFWGAPVPPKPGGTLRAGLGLRVPGGAACGGPSGGSRSRTPAWPPASAPFAGLPSGLSLERLRPAASHHAHGLRASTLACASHPCVAPSAEPLTSARPAGRPSRAPSRRSASPLLGTVAVSPSAAASRREARLPPPRLAGSPRRRPPRPPPQSRTFFKDARSRSRRVQTHAIPAPEPACRAALRADTQERTRGRPCRAVPPACLVATARHPARYGRRRFACRSGSSAASAPAAASQAPCGPAAHAAFSLPAFNGDGLSGPSRPPGSAAHGPFGDGHRLFAPLKTPVIKAGTVHRRYRRLMPLPVPDAAPLHPVTPTLRLLAAGGYALCHARCPLRGCKAGSRSSVPPDRPLP